MTSLMSVLQTTNDGPVATRIARHDDVVDFGTVGVVGVVGGRNRDKRRNFKADSGNSSGLD